ncbi:MAG: aminodeoxychorismate synthase component I [Clostridiales bacterium]
MDRIIKKLKDYKSIIDIFSKFKDEKYAVLLDSSLKNNLGKFSIIALNPYLTIIQGEKLEINGKLSNEKLSDFLKKYLNENKEINNTHLPIIAGAIGYFSYDYGRKNMDINSKHKDKINIPTAIWNFYDNFIIEDLEKKEIYIIANGKLTTAEQSINGIEQVIENKIPCENPQENQNQIEVLPNFTKPNYKETVANMIEYIIEGDIYIANMTQQLLIRSHQTPFKAFLSLRRNNPSPFGGYLNYGCFKIISASPERFMKMHQNKIETRPIKGTRKRGLTPDEDKALKTELQQSEKDKSELLMIVDLERNDLNKVCIPGSVKVTELFAVEEYATVFHLVSTIEGKLQSHLNAIDLIDATFPGGSITGAPKIRAMEIIDELENDNRNLYTGSFGYISLNGDMDLNIVIRTAIYKDGVYHLGVGGGITCESETEFEYEETLQKAKAILEALK